MIAHLRGKLLEFFPNRYVLECGGVGYLVNVSLTTTNQLNPVVDKELALYTHFHVRENAQTLYGFATPEERNLFLLLIDRVSGIGPSIAMAVLSGMPPDEFKGTVMNGDSTALAKIKGLGKKTAERIILELKDKVGVGETWQTPEGGVGQATQDAELALLALGYKQTVARAAIEKTRKDKGDLPTEELIRETLRSLG